MIDVIKKVAEKSYNRSQAKWRQKFVARWEKDFSKHYEAMLVIKDMEDKDDGFPEEQVVEYIFQWEELHRLQMLVSEVFYKKAMGLALTDIDLAVEKHIQQMAELPVQGVPVVESIAQEFIDKMTAFMRGIEIETEDAAV